LLFLTITILDFRLSVVGTLCRQLLQARVRH
jgi:hypothetical protein